MMSARDALFKTNKTATFENEESLPDLPVPDLKHTINAYLESVRAVVTDEEYNNTEVIARNFENGVGTKLQDILLNRAVNSKNWLEKWWEDVAYLAQRLPLIPYSNMSGAIPFFDFWPLKVGTRSERAALFLYSHMEFYQLMRKEQLKPVVNKGTPWSMSQFKRIFNGCRTPGEYKDMLISNFTTELDDSAQSSPPPTNVVVFYKGYIFSIELLHRTDGSLLTPHEIKVQLDYIENWCLNEADGNGPGIGALTSTERTKWAQNRQYLMELSHKNKSLLDTIENSVMAITFDDREPNSQIEILKNGYLNSCEDRWADKSLNDIAYKNGSFGANAEHTPFDGLAIATEYQYVFMSLHECAGVYKGTTHIRPLLPPKLLDFDIDDQLSREISIAKQYYHIACSDIEVIHEVFTDYGRSVSAKHKLHPEAYIQIALQAAYYRTHCTPAPTYCTATTRKFYRGRTETCRTCFPESVEFAIALAEGESDNNKLYELLQRAAKKFQELMSSACNGFGCDRHLLGLYLVAKENGINIPEMYTDPSYVKSGGNGNFVLSTSCAGYWKVCGSVPPMRKDGYSFFYGIENHQYSFTLSAFKSGSDTSVSLLYENLCATLADMKNVLDANI